MARKAKATASDLKALEELFGGYEPATADEVKTLEEPPRTQMNPLSKTYIANAVHGLMRVPSASLKPDFRATLTHWGALIKQALASNEEPQALVNAIMAIVATEGAFDALRMVRQVASQVLWSASVDVARDRRLASEVPENTFQDGESDHVDPDYVAPPTEDEAVDALVEAHGWLSSIADLLAVDEDDRIRLGLESGLEFTSRKEDDTWVRVYDVNDALDLQLEKNRESMKRRDSAKVLARKDAFKALAQLAA